MLYLCTLIFIMSKSSKKNVKEITQIMAIMNTPLSKHIKNIGLIAILLSASFAGGTTPAWAGTGSVPSPAEMAAPADRHEAAAAGETVLSVSNPDTWTASQLGSYVGKTVRLKEDWYVCTSTSSTYKVSPRRIFSPTNQAVPLSAEYKSIVSLNKSGTVYLNGVSGYHRTGERLHNAVVKVTSTSALQLVSGEWRGNSRSDILKGYDRPTIDKRGTHTLLVCAANLEYYLVKNLGTGYGPDSYAEHQKQRSKVSKALALINADIYGLVEIEQGQDAIAEIAADLTKLTGRQFSYVNDGGSANGSYTKSGYVYCSQTVVPYANFRQNQTGVMNRKYMQCFQEKATGERFILSINHFKAKSGYGSGDNADQGDGQGSFNADRVKEAKSVLSEYNYFRTFVNDEDILIMGDLNAYGKEDPIRALADGGMTDLHRYFHADSSYSYTYKNEAGYLDHALCNSTLLPQVTGMLGYHINSDERDSYTYDKDDDGTMFRYSDHDPVLVGLRLGKASDLQTEVVMLNQETDGATAEIRNATGGRLRMYTIQGIPVKDERIDSQTHPIRTEGLPGGVYVLHIYYNGQVMTRKLLVP